MTYCIGWKTGNAVILAADTALTSKEEDKLPLWKPITSFEEEHIKRTDGKVVEERGLKLFRIGDFILTYTGLNTSAHAIVKTLQDEITKGTPPRDALKTSLAANVSEPYPLAIICAFYEDGAPVLLSFNEKGDGQIIAHDNLVQLGSMPDVFKAKTSNYLGQCVESGDSAPRRVAKLLGVLHAYGRYNPIMRVGVGGAFSAIYLDAGGSHWQPDMLYMIDFKNKENNVFVSTCVREDCFLTVSPMIGVRKCLANVPPEQLRTTETMKKCMRVGDLAKQQHDGGKFDYVTILNGDFPVAVILEMNRKLKHELLWIKPLVSHDGAGLEFHMHPELSAMRDVPCADETGKPVPTIYFRPYAKPGLENIIKKKIALREKPKFTSARDGRINFTKY